MSAPTVVLRASGSHLHPGAGGSVDGAPPAAPVPCLVEFADGAAAAGTLAPQGIAVHLALGAYTTARGTRIPAKRWRLALAGRAFRVLGRA